MTGTKITSFENRIGELLDRTSGSDAEKAKMLGVSRQTISAWRTGVRSPRQPIIEHIASVFNVSVQWLMGFDVPMNSEERPTPSTIPTHPNILPIARRRVPLLGEIACGEPIYASEDASVYMAVGMDIHCDFALRCKGDSMIGARILDGDVVFIRQQEYVDDGAIAAVLIDDDATLKRVYHLADGRIELRAENPKYKPIVVGGEDDTRIYKILGKAVAFMSVII